MNPMHSFFRFGLVLFTVFIVVGQSESIDCFGQLKSIGDEIVGRYRVNLKATIKKSPKLALEKNLEPWTITITAKKTIVTVIGGKKLDPVSWTEKQITRKKGTVTINTVSDVKGASPLKLQFTKGTLRLTVDGVVAVFEKTKLEAWEIGLPGLYEIDVKATIKATPKAESAPDLAEFKIQVFQDQSAIVTTQKAREITITWQEGDAVVKKGVTSIEGISDRMMGDVVITLENKRLVLKTKDGDIIFNKVKPESKPKEKEKPSKK